MSRRLGRVEPGSPGVPRDVASQNHVPQPTATPVPAPIPGDVKPEVDSILEAIVYLYTESRRVTKEVARRVELTGPQLTVLKVLESVGDLSLSELSERIRAQNSTVTGIIDRMEREDLVVRARSSEDRRVVHIRLTDKGAKIAREIAIEPMEVFRSALESLSMTEMHDLLKILTKIAVRVKTIVKRDVVAGGREPREPRREPREPHESREPHDKAPP